MATIIQVGSGVVVLGAASALGWYGSQSLNKDLILYREEDVEQYNGKLRGKYKDLLLDPQYNKTLWIKAFNKYKKDVSSKSPEFSKVKVKSAFDISLDSQNSLNKVCGTVYKKDWNKTHYTEEDNKLISDLLKYCTPFLHSPTLVKDNDSEKLRFLGSIGANRQTSLISVLDIRNEEFWNFKHQQFFMRSSPIDVFFKPFWESEGKTQTLREKCAEAYEKNSHNPPSVTNPYYEDVIKYCSLNWG